MDNIQGSIQAQTEHLEKPEIEKEILCCWIVMPISWSGDYTKEHWSDVKNIIQNAIWEAWFNARLVSDADDSWIIQKRIIQNLYEDPIVVVDVSGKNPNVMFELGLRLAFDKPTIIIKDDKTDYSFDTAPIEHLCYPRDLRYQTIIDFKTKLRDKIIATHKSATNDPAYTTFLKHFGTVKVATLGEKTVWRDDYILSVLEDIKEEARRTRVTVRSAVRPRSIETDEELKSTIIEGRMAEFLTNNGLKSNYDIVLSKLYEECFEYVEKFPEVRKACRSRSAVREAIDKCIEKDAPIF